MTYIGRMESSKIKPLYKRGERVDCANYRVISLLASRYKICIGTTSERIKLIAHAIISINQNGARRDATVQRTALF